MFNRLSIPLMPRRNHLAKFAVGAFLFLALLNHLNVRHEVLSSSSTVSYKTFFDGMEKYAIHAQSLKDHYKHKEPESKAEAESKAMGDDSFLFSKEYLENILDISDDTFQKLKKSHHGYIHEHMDKLINKLGVSTFGNLRPESTEWDAYRGSSGYVLVGGGKYSWLSYLVVKQIRATGATLPIEIFIPTKADYELKFCEEVLPAYNARCNVLDQKLSEWLTLSFNINGYQYKMLAMLASKFENVLYLDSDLFPVRNMEHLFSSSFFKEKGLILWPDYWARTTNPKFYEIAELQVSEKKVRTSAYDAKHNKEKQDSEFNFQNSQFHDFENTLPNPTSEAGVLLVNKTSHLRTLLLALYYNVYGPHFYYPLMTQGAAGEGDKETFIAAALVMKEPWFQTLKQFHWVGYVREDTKEFVSKALGHYDPLTSKADSKDALIAFTHCSYPKYYTDWFYNNNDLVYKENGEHIRMYEGIYENLGMDLDLRLQQFFTQGACKDYYVDGRARDNEALLQSKEYMGNFLEYIGGDEKENEKRCREVYLPHLQWLKETTKYPNSLVF